MFANLFLYITLALAGCALGAYFTGRCLRYRAERQLREALQAIQQATGKALRS